MPQKTQCQCGCLTDPDFSIKYYKACLRYALKKRVHLEDAEDFASWAVIHFLEKQRHCINWAYVDYMRQLVGNKRSINYEVMHNLYFTVEMPENI